MQVKKVLLAVFLLPSISLAAHKQPEQYYQDKWCTEHQGQVEVKLPDQTRADCITDKNAIEFDFAKKWYEAIGQALYYGLQTGKKPGVVLIIESPNDRKYWIRMNSTIEHFKLPIDTYQEGI